MTERSQLEETWREYLLGQDRAFHVRRRWHGKLPSAPRCKICNAPFRGPGGLLMQQFPTGADVGLVVTAYSTPAIKQGEMIVWNPL